MVDIAAKIAASQKKMKEKQEAEQKQEEADQQQENLFSRALSAPQMAANPAAHGATLTIFDAVKMGDVCPSSFALLPPCNSLLSRRLQKQTPTRGCATDSCLMRFGRSRQSSDYG